jgi:hypothetical protein
MELQCNFYLHFLYGQRCWASFHMLISSLNFFVWKLSVQFICPFIQCIVDPLRSYSFGLPEYSGYESLVRHKDFHPF